MADLDIERLAKIAGLTEAIYNDPETGPEFDRLIEKKFPSAENPRHRLRTAADAELARVRELSDKFEQRLAKEQADRDLAADREAIRELGFTDSDVPAIEELMAKETIGSHRVAAEVLRNRREVARPSGPTVWDMPGQGNSGERYKGILDSDGKLNRKWGLTKAYEAFNELEAARKGARFGL